MLMVRSTLIWDLQPWNLSTLHGWWTCTTILAVILVGATSQKGLSQHAPFARTLVIGCEVFNPIIKNRYLITSRNFPGFFLFSRFKIRFNDLRIWNDIKEKSMWKITTKHEKSVYWLFSTARLPWEIFPFFNGDIIHVITRMGMRNVSSWFWRQRWRRQDGNTGCAAYWLR